MNENLELNNLFKESNRAKISAFDSNIHSNFLIDSKYEHVSVDFQWLNIMEDTIHYLDNILRNPNRFIINEEEVVKVEQARRITVESIKHLARHTNYIQEIEDNGDVIPSKILNINKDESYNTYESRFIYTLIQNMNDYVMIKKKTLIASSSDKDVKKCTYNGISEVAGEKVNINLSLDTRKISKKNDGNDGENTLAERIEKLELNIHDLTNSDVYKTLAKLHVARILPPIKKTNLILKNTNFQYAMKLWDFLQHSEPDSDKVEKKDDKYESDGPLKKMLDETFLINYLIVNSVNANGIDKNSEEYKKSISDITNGLINKIVELNADMPMDKLQREIGEKIAITKIQHEASLSEIQNIYNKDIDKFINRIESFRF